MFVRYAYVPRMWFPGSAFKKPMQNYYIFSFPAIAEPLKWAAASHCDEIGLVTR